MDYVEYISDEKIEGPVSDIISSIFQCTALELTERNNKRCILPSCHAREYYYDAEKQKIRLNKVFDEDFANFYALVSNNCEQELAQLQELFGSEWMNTMQTQLEKASETIMNRDNAINQLNVDDKIKSTIIGVREGEIPRNINPQIKERKNNQEERE